MSEIPDELRYTSEHLWARAQEGDPVIVRVGITDYAQDQLGDVISVTLPAVGTVVGAGETCADVESTKSVSDIDAPVPGTISATNTALEEAPETINTSPYGEGWLFEISLDPRSGSAALERLLDAAGYSRLTGG
ncbi:glycine cleavage system protein GcvH [Streptomyces sp. NPDC046805]|uniref:glycine cleavage system protein GcvH n=1 Tax=Streptomyces sp. NPDC046805 TaxID=3155134 RepID=UPI0033EDCDC0